MISIRPAIRSDLPAVSRFLAESFQGKKVEWYGRILNPSWAGSSPQLGFLLEDQGEVVGFIGAIWSEREIEDRNHVFYNMTSWCVKDGYRQHSLKLLQSLISRSDSTVTNFSASRDVCKILQFYRFQELDTGKTVYSPLSRIPSLFMGKLPEMLIGVDAVYPQLTPVEQRIVDDHKFYSCFFILLRKNESRCFLIVLKRPFKQFYFADVLYCSDWELLGRWVPVALWAAWKATGVFFLGVDNRFVIASSFFSFQRKRQTFFKSETLTPDRIDSLYSEFVPDFGYRGD
mgnify:CR=1 FL=1|jgi:hypothetical protein|tara:strand:+ start:708 stop:1568 length:861 start_codon:yes stop_codon:yes gene_type:complete